MATESTRQYKRNARLVVGKAGSGLSIENLRIVFSVTKTQLAEPNEATIKIFNLTPEHQATIREEFTDVILTAGYEGAESILFSGNIKHVYRYREGNDWIVEIDCGDGDRDYRRAIINETMAAGVTDAKIIERVCDAFKTTKKGDMTGIGSASRTRGKVISGACRDVLQDVAREHGATWSVQNGLLEIVKLDGVLKTEAIVVNAATGMLGTPEQDDKGIKVDTLLNPLYQVNGRIKLDNNSIKMGKQKTGVTNKGDTVTSTEKTANPARLDPDGIYKIYKVTHTGDTHGADWKSTVETVAMASPYPTTSTAGAAL